MNNVEDLKKDVESIDSMIASLLQKRLEIVKQIGGNVPMYSPARKAYIINNIVETIDDQYRDYYIKLQNYLYQLTELYQDELANRNDPFLKDFIDHSIFSDGAFALSYQASCDYKKNPETVINATIGTLFNEDNKIVALKTVYDCFNKEVSNERKASYADTITGNNDFNEAIYSWLDRDKQLTLPHEVVATAGGTGALALAFANFFNDHDTILLPSIAWGSYKLMAQQSHLDIANYDLVNSEGQPDISGLMSEAIKVMKKQRKLIVVVNDPCHNPTGLSLGNDNWQKLIYFLNKMSEFGKVVLIVDVAYLDYGNVNGRDFLKHINNISEHVLVEIALSCSKTMTAYGMRLGAAVVISKQQKEIDNIHNAFAKTARALWSNVNNGLMDCFVKVVNEHKEDLENEIAQYRALLQERATLFLEQAKQYQLPLYPYEEGFFITVKFDDTALMNKYHARLLEKHIYTIKFDGGIRIAICSLNKTNCQKLPKLLHETFLEVNHE